MPAADRAGSSGPAASWMESATMSLAASQRRDQRRRLVVSWNRSASTPSSSQPEPRRLADYAPEALPEHQPSLATLLPTGLGGFALAATGLLVFLAAAVGVGLWEAVAGAPVFGRDATRFAATLASVRRCLAVQSLLSLGGWLAQISLVSATATALIVIPIAVTAAADLAVSPRPVLMAVNVAAAAALITPVATPANMMVMEPGGYRFGDYWKLGLPLMAWFAVVGIGIAPLIWRF